MKQTKRPTQRSDDLQLAASLQSDDDLAEALHGIARMRRTNVNNQKVWQTIHKAGTDGSFIGLAETAPDILVIARRDQKRVEKWRNEHPTYMPRYLPTINKVVTWLTEYIAHNPTPETASHEIVIPPCPHNINDFRGSEVQLATMTDDECVAACQSDIQWQAEFCDGGTYHEVLAAWNKTDTGRAVTPKRAERIIDDINEWLEVRAEVVGWDSPPDFRNFEQGVAVRIIRWREKLTANPNAATPNAIAVIDAALGRMFA